MSDNILYRLKIVLNQPVFEIVIHKLEVESKAKKSGHWTREIFDSANPMNER